MRVTTLVLFALAALVVLAAVTATGVDAQPKVGAGARPVSAKVTARRSAQSPEHKAKVEARIKRIRERMAARRAANGGKPQPNAKPNGKPTTPTAPTPNGAKPGATPGRAGAGAGGAVAATAATAPNGEPAAEADVKAFRDALMAFLNKYKGAVEGSAKFAELFPRIEADRKATPGYTTCVTFQNLAIGAASAQTKLKLRSTPNVNFFDAQLRRKHQIPPNSFMAVPPTGKTAADMSADKTATYVDLSADKSPRPEPGDLFLLAFSKSQSATLKAGYFSHIGFVTAIKKLPDGKEEWTTVAGGGGSARNKQEAVTEGHMIVDPKTGLTGSVANQPGSERKLQGWVVLKNLITKG